VSLALTITPSLDQTGCATIGLKMSRASRNGEPKVGQAQGRVSSSGFPLEWVRRSREGDSQAMELLYGRFKTSFFGLAYRYTYNATAAEDILQDIFIKIFTHIHKLDNDEAFILSEEPQEYPGKNGTLRCGGRHGAEQGSPRP